MPCTDLRGLRYRVYLGPAMGHNRGRVGESYGVWHREGYGLLTSNIDTFTRFSSWRNVCKLSSPAVPGFWGGAWHIPCYSAAHLLAPVAPRSPLIPSWCWIPSRQSQPSPLTHGCTWPPGTSRTVRPWPRSSMTALPVFST